MIQKKRRTHDILLQLSEAQNLGIGVAIALAFFSYDPMWKSLFAVAIVVSLAVTPIIQTIATFILLIGRKKWRDLARAKYKNKLFKALMYHRPCYFMDSLSLYSIELPLEIFCAPVTIVWKLQKYLFKLQYRAIVGPDRLESTPKR